VRLMPLRRRTFGGSLLVSASLWWAAFAQSRVRLRQCVDGEQVVGLRAMARRRFEVRELETKLRDLNRLIAVLDRRFSALWAREG
jgi:hypothetical protein